MKNIHDVNHSYLISLFVDEAVAIKLPSWKSSAVVKAILLPILRILAFASTLPGRQGKRYFISRSSESGLTLNSCKFKIY